MNTKELIDLAIEFYNPKKKLAEIVKTYNYVLEDLSQQGYSDKDIVDHPAVIIFAKSISNKTSADDAFSYALTMAMQISGLAEIFPTDGEPRLTNPKNRLV